MSSSRGITLLMSVGALASADAGWLVAESFVSPRPDAFQTATGGTGLGAAVSAAWSWRAFDARLEPTCENELWPIAGLSCPNPCHGASVVELPRMERSRK